MNSKDFLRLVWPSDGFFCIATPHINKTTGKPGYAHRVFDTMDEAYIEGRSVFASKDVYFCIFTHVAQGVMSQTYGRMVPSRKRENMKEAKTLFLDLDVGKAEKNKPKYRSQADGLAALARFLFLTGLPDPIVVSSGNGLHVYWPLSDALAVNDWKGLAINLRMLLDKHAVIYDPSRTIDVTSVLRMPATLNHKDPNDPKPVKILFEAVATDTDEMAFQLAFLTRDMQPVKVNTPFTVVPGGLVGNISPHGMGFPPTDADDVAAECEQIRIFRDSNGNISEPHWYAALGVVGFCTGGRAVAHKWSSGHPQYSQAETDAKLDQWQGNGSVSSCAKLGGDGVPGVCARCPHFQSPHKNPIVITNKKPVLVAALAQAPVVALPAQSLPPAPPPLPKPIIITALPHIGCPLPVCDPAWPYTRTQALGIAKADAKGMVVSVIENADIYPIAVTSGLVESGDKVNYGISTWVCREMNKHHKIDWTIFEVNNLHLSDNQRLHTTFSQNGIFIPATPELARYMSAYLKELKSHVGLNRMFAHLGWPAADQYDKFILNKRVIDSNGQVGSCILAPQTDIATGAFTRAGTFSGQVDALRFYNDTKAYAAQQFFILCSLACPLFVATGHHGVVVNLSGESGASKSTAMKAAAAIWANPALFMVNGTPRGMSAMARDLRAMSLPNLPTLIDEITLMEAEDARAMVMGASQPFNRITLNQDRSMREAKTGAVKAAYMLTTANISLHQLINTHGKAGTANSARVLELIAARAKLIHTKDQADKANHDFSDNYGWLGEQFMQLAMPTIRSLMDSVEHLMSKLNADLGITGHERFYAAAAAPVFVAGAFAAHHGLIDWNMDALYKWFCEEQFPLTRGVLNNETKRLSHINVMRDFIGASTLDTITDDGSGNIPPANIRTEVIIHHKMALKELWLHRAKLRDYCEKRGVVYTALVADLAAKGIVKTIEARRTLGEGTRYGLARAHVVIVHADHPAIV